MLFRSYQILTNQDFNIRLVDVKNAKNNGFLAGVSLPPSSRAPRVSLAPKTPFPKTAFPFPFKSLPRRLTGAFFVIQSHTIYDVYHIVVIVHFHQFWCGNTDRGKTYLTNAQSN